MPFGSVDRKGHYATTATIVDFFYSNDRDTTPKFVYHLTETAKFNWRRTNNTYIGYEMSPFVYLISQILRTKNSGWFLKNNDEDSSITQ